MKNLLKEYWLSQKWGKLKLDPNQELPNEWSKGCNNKFKFICDCGKTAVIKFENVTKIKYNTKTCGHCNDKPKEYWLNYDFGEIKLKKDQPLPDAWPNGCNKKFLFTCPCGRNFTPVFDNVMHAGISSCRHCTEISKEYWLSQKWGKLILDKNQKLPDEWSQACHNKYKFICDCGNLTTLPFCKVTIKPTPQSKPTKSCHHCNDESKEYWLSQKWGKLTLDPNQELPDIWSFWCKEKYKFICDCGNISTPAFGDVTCGKSKSCGCTQSGRTLESPAGEIFNFIKKFTPDAIFGYRINPPSLKEYDIYIPSHKLAIEFHGLVWHSEKYNNDTPLRDHEKYLLAKIKDDRLIQIYGDEWENKQEIVKSYLKEILAPCEKTIITPSYKVIKGKTPKDVKNYINCNNIVGCTSGSINIIAKYNNEIVGAWIFQKTGKTAMLVSIAKNNSFGFDAISFIKNSLLKLGYNKITSFADNRLEIGELYEQFGFTFEKEIKPDFSYTKNHTRCLKSEYNKNKKKGYYKIWDSGKNRYSLKLT
jgi:hypothetical protein